MSRAVRFDVYGDVDVLDVVEVERPVPGDGEVLVEVRAAGINPGEAKIRRDLLHAQWPATFPSGQGSDLAGVVAARGAGVETVAVGDEVIMTEVAGLLASGELELPIVGRFALDDVREAYNALAAPHPPGKIVLIP